MFQAQKYPNLAAFIDLSKAETQNNHMETRLLQLNYAISMELWQEAYKAVEDIYHLMNLSRNKPKPGQMYNYYSKLSLIFWKANNYLFHAATLQKLFVLLKDQKKTMTQEELSKVCTRLLLATLAIPIPPNRSSIDEVLDQDETTIEKLKRLSSLLNLQQAPTRLSLLKDLQKYNVVQHVNPEIRDLYKSLEVDFNPLKLSDRVNKCLDFIESRPEVHSEYLQYVQPIKEITVTRLVKQVAQIYTTIEIQRFVQLAPKGIEQITLENLIVDSAKQLDLQVRINHQTKSLQFGNDSYVAQKDDLPEGPSIQNMPSEQIRNQLIAMSDALQQARQLIYQNETKSRINELAVNIANVYRQTHEKHHIDLLRRKQMIEKQKEMYEMLTMERERLKNEKKKQEERDLALSKAQSRQYAEEAQQQDELKQSKIHLLLNFKDQNVKFYPQNLSTRCCKQRRRRNHKTNRTSQQGKKRILGTFEERRKEI
jgi:translation initiation factor 3 subunit A